MACRRRNIRGFSAHRALLCSLLLCACVASLAGCARYRIGNASLYPTHIETVYVPVFQSNSFRRGLGERLTEAVMKEISLKTPYTVVGTPDADSTLSGRIVTDTKRIVIESPTDEGRELDMNFQIVVSWVDHRGDYLRPVQTIPVPPAMVDVGQSALLVPEVGQSVAVTQQQAIQRLAEQIVGLMETPW